MCFQGVASLRISLKETSQRNAYGVVRLSLAFMLRVVVGPLGSFHNGDKVSVSRLLSLLYFHGHVMELSFFGRQSEKLCTPPSLKMSTYTHKATPANDAKIPNPRDTCA